MKIKAVLTVLLFLLATLTLNANEIVRLTNGEWSPLTSEKIDNYGPISYLVEETFRIEGVKVEYGFFPWNRGLELAKLGEWDGSLLWAKNSERENNFYFSQEPLYTVENVFFFLKSSKIEWKSDEELKKYKIGVTKGFFYGVEFENTVNRFNISTLEAYDDFSNFRNLLLGRIDMFICASKIGISILEKQLSEDDASKITYNKNKSFVLNEYLVLNKMKKENKVLMKKFDSGYKKLKDNGKYESIIKELN